MEGKRTIRLNAKRQRSSSCDDGNSRKGPRVRDNRPFVLVLNKIIVVIRVISDVIERDLFNPINLLNEPGLIFYVVLKIATLVPRPGSFRPKCQKSFED